MTNNIEQLKDLTEQEREEVLKILSEISDTGNSESLNKLTYADYKEIPVDIETFITDDQYLGKAWHSSEGKLKLYPYWLEVLKEIFPDNISTSINNLIESGARGLGKSEIAVTIGLYLMYRVMCLKNAQEFYHLKPTEKLAFAFMNITKYLAEDIGITKFQATVQMSPWFMERGTVTGINVKTWNPPDYIDIIVGSQPSHVIGQPIYFAFFDEIDFIKNQDIEKQKQIATDMIDTAIGGMKTRFLHKGNNPTVLVLASSKRSEKSFLEEHMKKKLADEDELNITKIVDEPVWNVKPPETYSGKKFKVGIGNKFLASEIIPDDADSYLWTAKGYNVIDVPVEFKSEFKDNIDRALCDFAGVASSDLIKYISATRLMSAKTNETKNLFVKDIIEVGNAPDDKIQYYDFINMDNLDRRMLSMPLYIHLDMSVSGDKTGIAGVWIKGKKPSTTSDAKEMYFQLAFNVSIKAPRGYQVSFAKNREFIYWLKEQGFNIKGISSDTFQNVAVAQELVSRGFDYKVISVDRTNQQHICEPYQYLKNAIYEQRILIYEDSPLLTEELLGLERNGNTGKIDHPDGGKYGCFTGDTKVSLVDGRELTMLELVDEYNSGKTNYVYSFNETLKIIEPKKIKNAWCTIKNANLVEVELDSGELIRCTPNHKFMMRDGSYREAQELNYDDSLMPLYRKFPAKGTLTDYRLYYEPIEDKWHYEHRRFAQNVLDEKKSREALNKINEESKHLKELCPNIDKEKFFDIFGFDYDDLPAAKKPSYCTKYRKIVCKDILNHRVVSVRFLDYVEDVYDLTIEDNHNFALSSGIFVHNSKDAADAMCGALWNASQNAEQFVFDYGETIDTIIDVANQITNTQQQVMVDFEEELKQASNQFGQSLSQGFEYTPLNNHWSDIIIM